MSENTSPAWMIENFLEICNHNLHINGVSAVGLAQQFGTPLFVFSETRIRENIDRLRQAESVIDCPLKICYAAKANSNMAILRTVKDAGSDLEVNSGGELWKALQAGFTGEQIIFNGTSKEIWELENAINAGIYAIQADSLAEIELIENVAQNLAKRANVSLRIVPEIETETLAGLKTAMNSSKFGMTFDDALIAFRRWQTGDKHLNLCGIHLHIGSQTPHAASYTEAFEFLWEKLKEIFDETGHRLSHLNLGGGFPVNYLRDKSSAEAIIDENKQLFAANFAPAEAIGKAWQRVKSLAEAANAADLLSNLTLLIEPGRSVIADAGICLTTVRNTKSRPLKQLAVSSEQLAVSSEPFGENRGKLAVSGENSEDFTRQSKIQNPKSKIDEWLLTDAGFNILLSMETYKWYYHLISATRADEKHLTAYKVAGPLCDGGDVYFDIEGKNRLPDYRLLPENVAPNEILALLNCGAYSIAQMFQYNGRFLPAVVLIRENGAIELIRRRDNFADLVTNDIW